MRTVILAVLMGAALVFAGGCAKDGGDVAGGNPAPQHSPKQPPPGEGSTQGLVAPLKEKRLAQYEATTIGNAFDSYRYFEKREWKETRTSNGKVYVDFWGWLKKGSLDAAAVSNGVVARGVAVKFAINADGSFYVAMISRAEIGADGKEHDYPVGSQTSILDAIYGNKEISY